MPLAAFLCLALAAKLEEVGVPSDISALQVASPACTHTCCPFTTSPLLWIACRFMCLSCSQQAMPGLGVLHEHACSSRRFNNQPRCILNAYATLVKSSSPAQTPWLGPSNAQDIAQMEMLIMRLVGWRLGCLTAASLLDQLLADALSGALFHLHSQPAEYLSTAATCSQAAGVHHARSAIPSTHAKMPGDHALVCTATACVSI